MRFSWTRNRDGYTKAESAAHTSAGSANTAPSGFVMTLTMGGNKGSSSEIIAVVKTAEAGYGDNLRTRWGTFSKLSVGRRLLAQPEMRSIIVMVVDIHCHKAFQMALVKHNHMVEQIAAAVADEPLSHAVLPRAFEGSTDRIYAEDFSRCHYLGVESGIAVVNQISRRGVIRKGVAQLLRYPRAGWMPGHIEVQDAPPVMRNHKEAIQNSKGKRRHGEEIHCRDGFTMIAQKRCPAQGISASDAAVPEQQVAAARPGFPEAGRGENKNNEGEGGGEASAGEAFFVCSRGPRNRPWPAASAFLGVESLANAREFVR